MRTVVRGLFVLAGSLHLLNPVRYGLFAWQLASHKLCRWLVPFGMIGALVANAVLVARSPLYLGTFVAQCAFYLAALAGRGRSGAVLKIPSFLVMANFAVLVAWLRYIRGERIRTWNPSERLPRPAVSR
jgi:hypothetical protein